MKVLLQKTSERSVINYYQEIFYNKILLKKPFAEYMIYCACGRLNKQKVQHDRRAVADVTIYYLCVHMCDKEFMATMVLSCRIPILPLTSWSSQQHIIRRRFQCVPRIPDVLNFLPIPAMHLNGWRFGRCDNRRSIVRQSNTTRVKTRVRLRVPLILTTFLATYRRFRPTIILRSDFRH